MAAPAFRSNGAMATTAGGFTTGVNVPYPAGLVAGDLLLLQLSYYNTSGPLIVPSGWTVLFGPVTPTNPSSELVNVLYKIATGSESGTLNVKVSVNSTPIITAIMSAWSGCGSGSPVDVYATSSLPSSGTSGTNPSVTTTGVDRRVLHMFWVYSSSATVTPNASDTERYESGADSNMFYNHEVADRAQAVAGASGTSSATFSTSISGGVAATIALKPPAAGLAGVKTLQGVSWSSVKTVDGAANASIKSWLGVT